MRRKFQTHFTRPLAEDLGDGSHPYAAFERTQFHNQLVNLAKEFGSTFVMDMSMADVRQRERGVIRGNRYHYVDKDLQMPIIDDEPNPEDIVVLTDSDYLREDMPEIIANNPTLLYTFFPETTGGTIRNGRFCITADNLTHSLFHGGGDGDQAGGHPIWAWDADCVSVADDLGRTVVLIERRKVSKHRIVVFTVPVAWIPNGYSSPTDKSDFSTIPAAPFRRKRYAHVVRPRPDVENPALPTHVIALKSLDEDGHSRMHLSLPGEDYCVSLLRCDYVALCQAYSLARRQGITANLCDPPLSGLPKEERITAARTLHAIMLASGGKILLAETTASAAHRGGQLADIYKVLREGPPNDPDDAGSNARVVDDDSTADTEAPNPGRTIGRALVDRNTVQAANQQLERSIVDTRILSARTDEKPIPRAVRRRYTRYMDEYVEKEFGAVKDTLSPLDCEEVDEMMTKASQHADYDQVIDFLHHNFTHVKAFVKKEATSKPSKHPHLIQPVSKEHKVLYSRYILAASKVLKGKDWYAFGKSPKEIADRVHMLACEAENLTITDYKQWDSSIKEFMNELKIRGFKSLFHPAHKDEIERLIRSENNIDAKLPLGTKFSTATMVLSGSPATAFGNSFMNGFTSFCAFRESGVAAKDIKLGIYGGDDGMNLNLDPKWLRKVADDLGLTVDVEASQAPDLPITFLARTYVNPKQGPGSCCDARRALGKLHLTTAPVDVPLAVVLARKAAAHLITDSKTPLIGDLARLLQRSEPELTAELLGKGAKGELTVDEVGYNVAVTCKIKAEKGEETGYPPPDNPDEATKYVADALEIDIMQLESMIEYVNEVDDWTQLHWPRICQPKWVAKYKTEIDDQIFEVGDGEEDGLRIFSEGNRMVGIQGSQHAAAVPSEAPAPKPEKGKARTSPKTCTQTPPVAAKPAPKVAKPSKIFLSKEEGKAFQFRPVRSGPTKDGPKEEKPHPGKEPPKTETGSTRSGNRSPGSKTPCPSGADRKNGAVQGARSHSNKPMAKKEARSPQKGDKPSSRKSTRAPSKAPPPGRARPSPKSGKS
jgi:hypothetical protein